MEEGEVMALLFTMQTVKRLAALANLQDALCGLDSYMEHITQKYFPLAKQEAEEHDRRIWEDARQAKAKVS
jgi:hypothetical protein